MYARVLDRAGAWTVGGTEAEITDDRKREGTREYISREGEGDTESAHICTQRERVRKKERERGKEGGGED